MANPCEEHTDFQGDRCPVCLNDEKEKLQEKNQKALEKLQQAENAWRMKKDSEVMNYVIDAKYILNS